MVKKHYVAYGSNLNIGQMRMRCPGAKVIGTAFIDNYELLFKGSRTGSYLTIEPKAGSRVPVAVWEVTVADEQALDRYEGFPSFYYKKDMTLEVKGLRSGKPRTMDAFVYIMHEDRPYGIPSLGYVRTCLSGYFSFGFDAHYLVKAKTKSEEKCYGK